MCRRHLVVAAFAVAASACNKAPPPPAESSAAQPADEEPKLPNVHEGAGGSGPGAPASPAAAGSTTGAPGGPKGTTAAGGAPDRDTGGAGSTTGSAEPPPPDPKALLKEARSKRTPDDVALARLAEAEAAGASPRELARAALARGKALFATPDRAAAFFTWAKDKDPNYAEPVFELARQAAMQGDVPKVKELLAETAKRRGGRKLLQQLDFDPTWDIVKDDPDVRALMK
ncbi:MAG: hypothetical protein D6705_03685 [Deltaproteobacteria bacterium]|nr:MAG: hypothetical protein D6705_03685 [Deltaproteobacteria bacterium]